MALINWHKYPLLRLFIPFLLGTLLAVNHHIFWPFLPFLIIFLLLILILLNSRLRSHISLHPVNAIFTFVIFFLLGIFVVQQSRDIFKVDHYSHHLEKYDAVLVKISDPPVEKARSLKAEVKVLELMNEGRSKKVSGKALCYIAKDSAAYELKYGDILLLNNSLQPISPPGNPHEFNYRKYLSFHNIHHQVYANSTQWQLITRDEGSQFYSAIYGARRYLLQQLKKYITDDKAMAVSAALLIGYRDLLDPELVRSYSSSGAMHVLAVSGLHVGIIYIILNLLLRPLNRKKHLRKYIKPAILLICIWFYAFITGLSPSVSRAATMFSFITIGQISDRPINIYSSIIASAFFLLIINPFLITEVGFLLSYLAVIGIVFFQPKFYRQIYFKNWLLDKIWGITCVSLAAQIATFPIGLLYFHQFPTYFLLSNLFVIPAAMLILGTGVAFFFFSAVPVLNDILGNILFWIIKGLNILILAVQELPYSLISGITISVAETYLIYAFIIVVATYILSKKKIYLTGSFSLILLLISSFTFRNISNQEKSQLIVHRIPDASAINLIDQKNSLMIAGRDLLDNEDKMRFHIKHHWWALGIREIDVIQKDNLPDEPFTFKNKRIAIVGNSLPLIQGNIDIFILTGNPNIPLRQLLPYDPEMIVMDASNQQRKVREWLKACDSLHLPCYDIRERGAFILNM